MTDRQLQRDFERKTFIIDNIKRQCYYCTLEDEGAWIWLHPNNDDKCNKINFVVYNQSSLENLYIDVTSGNNINLDNYGRLSFQ